MLEKQKNIPAEITKTKTARTTHLTEEASFALREYLHSCSDTSERLFLITYNRAEKKLSILRETYMDLAGFEPAASTLRT